MSCKNIDFNTRLIDPHRLASQDFHISGSAAQSLIGPKRFHLY